MPRSLFAVLVLCCGFRSRVQGLYSAQLVDLSLALKDGTLESLESAEDLLLHRPRRSPLPFDRILAARRQLPFVDRKWVWSELRPLDTHAIVLLEGVEGLFGARICAIFPPRGQPCWFCLQAPASLLFCSICSPPIWSRAASLAS